MHLRDFDMYLGVPETSLDFPLVAKLEACLRNVLCLSVTSLFTSGGDDADFGEGVFP